MQILGITSLLLCVLTMFLIYVDYHVLAVWVFGLALVLLILSLALLIREIQISTGALSVQLSDIRQDSRLCLAAETRALSADSEGGYRIDNGPFMRRFLDGYYAMRVSQKIILADSGLAFSGIEPAVQPGFAVSVSNESIDFDAWFEGRLKTKVELIQSE